MSRPLVVVLGGTRSGKSRFARERAMALAGGGAVAYIATAVAGDPELDERIALHRRGRPGDWTTIEPGLDLVSAIGSIATDTTILLDGLTLWLSLVVDTEERRVESIVDGPVARLQSALRGHDGPAIVVSDEVGLGIVPTNDLARFFRDVIGITHQRLIADADEAWFIIAGRAIRLEEPAGL